jgi:hypothetical protein
MTRILYAHRTDADPVVAAAELLATTGVALMPSSAVMQSLGVGREAWTRFDRHWRQLAPDPYAEGPGVQVLGRYGRYLVLDGVAHRLPTPTFAQPEDPNPPYIDRDREFEPLTDAFAEDPLLHNVINLLTRMAASLDDVAEWNVKVHPFRIRCPARDGDDNGHPRPEDPHRDGVTLISSLLIGRRNAIGGECSVCGSTGRRLLTTTFAEPGTLLLGDDRRTLHAVSPIRPRSGSMAARRDILVITFASVWP